MGPLAVTSSMPGRPTKRYTDDVGQPRLVQRHCLEKQAVIGLRCGKVLVYVWGWQRSAVAEDDMATELVRTKLYIPPVREELVSRPRLLERLNAGLHRNSTLISAPAGFGKTTLLSEWISGGRRPLPWVSLDKGHNAPVHFGAYFIAALQRVRAGVGEGDLSRKWRRTFSGLREITSEMPVWLSTTVQCVRSRRRIGSISARLWRGDITDIKARAAGIIDEEAILHKAALLVAEAGFQPGRGGDGQAPCQVVHYAREEKHELVLEDGSVYARG